MRRALVLNATYEPLSIVPARRAVCLLIDDKADLVEADDAVIDRRRSPSASPAVIRLRYMVRAPRRRVAAVSRRAVFARDDYRCQYCGNHADSIDHVVPRSRGGRDVWDNLAAACRPVQQPQTRPHARRGRHATVPSVSCAPRNGVDRGRRRRLVPDTWKPYLAIAS